MEQLEFREAQIYNYFRFKGINSGLGQKDEKSMICFNSQH